MVLIIAEAGVNHNGCIKLAKQLVDAAKSCNADIVKFQFFKADDLVVPNTEKAAYQKRDDISSNYQLDMLRKLELSYEEQKDLKIYCDKKNIEFLTSGFDLNSLNDIKKLNLKRYKIPSGEITNFPYLKFVGSQEKPIIISTGMANIDEIRVALEVLNASGARSENISVLHCTSEYPAPLNEINLRAMSTIKELFKVNVGYSDHTLGIEVSLAAVALGAQVIEKHLTLDRNFDGPDHKASLIPDEFKMLVKGIRNISIALGSNEKKVGVKELENLPLVRKSIVAKKDIKKGDIFSVDNLCSKRPGTGMSPMLWDEIIGKRAKKNFRVNDFITFN